MAVAYCAGGIDTNGRNAENTTLEGFIPVLDHSYVQGGLGRKDNGYLDGHGRRRILSGSIVGLLVFICFHFLSFPYFRILEKEPIINSRAPIVYDSLLLVAENRGTPGHVLAITDFPDHP